jgi:hypothetical protein
VSNKKKLSEQLGELELRRDFVFSIGTCDFCSEELVELMPEEEMVLCVAGREFQWIMCDYHEGEMLQKLINNFIKRKRKGRSGGFKGPFMKEEVCELCFDLMEQNKDGTQAMLPLPPKKEEKKE